MSTLPPQGLIHLAGPFAPDTGQRCIVCGLTLVARQENAWAEKPQQTTRGPRKLSLGTGERQGWEEAHLIFRGSAWGFASMEIDISENDDGSFGAVAHCTSEDNVDVDDEEDEDE